MANRLEKLEAQRRQLDERIKKARRAASQQQRKDDTRRKIIAGALALEHMEKNPESGLAKTMHRLLNEYVTKPNERQLMGLDIAPNDNVKDEFSGNASDEKPGT